MTLRARSGPKAPRAHRAPSAPVPGAAAPAGLALAALAAVVLLTACSADTAPLPDGAPALRVLAGGPVATCAPPTGPAVVTLDAQPVRLVENSGASVPTTRIELSGTVTGSGGRPLVIVAGGADALCPLVDATVQPQLGDGAFRAGVDVVDGVRVFAMISDASLADLSCDAGCLDAGTRTIYGISESVVVHLE